MVAGGRQSGQVSREVRDGMEASFHTSRVNSPASKRPVPRPAAPCASSSSLLALGSLPRPGARTHPARLEEQRKMVGGGRLGPWRRRDGMMAWSLS